MTKRAKIIAMVQLPPPMHGAAKMNRHALNALSDQFNVTVIEMRFAKNLHDVASFSIGKALRAVWLLMKLIFALPRSQALYICFAPTSAAYYRDCLYVLTAKLFGVPAILHLHGRGLPSMRNAPWTLHLQKLVFANQTVILLGERLRSEISGLNCAAHIIRNCVEAKSFSSLRLEDWAPGTPVRLLWFSNLFRAKGIETLISSCARLRKTGLNCHLTIAGAPGDIDKNELAQLLAEHGMKDAACYIGPVSGNDRHKVFSDADLFVLPTNYPNEAQPLVVIEAMTAGLPVITTNIATLPEFVRDGETGWTCIPDSVEAVATAIRKACASPVKTGRMRDNAFQICQEDFSYDRFARDLRKLMS
jgi:glycosyltransferase involved in cell wall biosynthesis